MPNTPTPTSSETSPIPPISRLNVACEQLDVAIDLFFSGRSYVSALTLAGAAEEIAGKTLELAGGRHVMKRRYEERRLLLSRRGLAAVKKFSDFAEPENYARNAAKHAGEPRKASNVLEDQYFRANPREAATKMILRAMHNMKLLSVAETDQTRRFFGWYMLSTYGGED